MERKLWHTNYKYSCAQINAGLIEMGSSRLVNSCIYDKYTFRPASRVTDVLFVMSSLDHRHDYLLKDFCTVFIRVDTGRISYLMSYFGQRNMGYFWCVLILMTFYFLMWCLAKLKWRLQFQAKCDLPPQSKHSEKLKEGSISLYYPALNQREFEEENPSLPFSAYLTFKQRLVA